jgi:hypothetical protein
VEIGSGMMNVAECLCWKGHKLRPVAAQGGDAWKMTKGLGTGNHDGAWWEGEGVVCWLLERVNWGEGDRDGNRDGDG